MKFSSFFFMLVFYLLGLSILHVRNHCGLVVVTPLAAANGRGEIDFTDVVTLGDDIYTLHFTNGPLGFTSLYISI